MFFWLGSNHFAKQVKTRPIVLLLNGHSTHIDIDTSQFCKELAWAKLKESQPKDTDSDSVPELKSVNFWNLY